MSNPSELKVTVEEDILSNSVEQLVQKWKQALNGIERPGSVSLDIGGVKTVNSQGLNLLIGFYKECLKRNLGFRVVNCSQDLKHLFSLLKLSERLGIA